MADAPSAQSKAQLMNEIQMLIVQVNKIRQSLKGLTKLAEGLSLMKDIDKMERAAYKMKSSVGELQL